MPKDPSEPTDPQTFSSADANIPAERPRWLPKTFRSLRHRNYRLYFFAQLISFTGTWMQTTVLMALVYNRTGQNKWTSFIFAAQIAPTFLLAPWAGALADRWAKRSLLIATHSASLVLALALAALVHYGEETRWGLLAVSLAIGIVVAIDLPTRMAFVTDMVGRDDVINAVALNSVLFNSARMVGPVIGVYLLAWFGPATCFAANGLSYVPVIWALWSMDVTGRPHRHALRRSSAWAGFAYLAGKPSLLFLVLVAFTTAFCGWPSQSLLPGFAERVLEEPEEAYGMMLSGTGFGALLAALSVARFGSANRQRRFIAAGIMIVSAGLIGLSVVRLLPLAAGCCVLIGYGLILFLATSQGVIQLSAAEHNRGQIMAIWAMTLSGAVPLGNMVFGPAADRWGVAPVLRFEGLACLGFAIALAALLQIWRKRRPIYHA